MRWMVLLVEFGAVVLVVWTLGCAGGAAGSTRGDESSSAVLAATSEGIGQSETDGSITAPGLSAPEPYPLLNATVVPPVGWQPDPVKKSSTHAHQTWVSPSRSTAYGVIRMNLPLPFIGPNMVLRPFLDQMRRTEGQAILLSRQADRRLPGSGIRFVAEGGTYRIRVNLMTRGYRAWAVYAGTRRDAAEVPAELRLAEQARERTKIGLPRRRS